MAHREQIEFVKSVKNQFPQHFQNAKVLEVGSRIVCGTCRGLFDDCNYTGIDMEPGPGVQIVVHAADYQTESLYDTVICCEALEHDKRWKETLASLVKLTRPGGLLIITAAGPDRVRHNDENGYYGNISQTDLKRNLKERELFSDHVIRYDRGKLDIQMYAVKRETPVAPEPKPKAKAPAKPRKTAKSTGRGRKK